MVAFLLFVVALALTMALIPPLMRVADSIGALDVPEQRKIHSQAIPRVGGVAMIIGALIPILVWAPMDRSLVAVLVGIGIIGVFGVWDDRKDLDYRIKFFGQIAAALVVILFGQVIVEHLFLGTTEPMPAYLSLPITLLFLVGVTNAINLADGLDGLAGGTSMLSLAVTAILAYRTDMFPILAVSLSVMGVILGFLRFNTYPARVFMGDTGSQFLGFTLATLTLMLTQSDESALSPVLPLLILGLPILDTVLVMGRRIAERRSPFSPDRNHIHHRLLALGLQHHEAVVAIYLLQGVFVSAAYVLRYESNILILTFYASVSACVLGFFYVSKRFRWKLMRADRESRLAEIVGGQSVLQSSVPLWVVTAGSALFVFGISIASREVPYDLAVAASFVFGILLVRLILGYRAWLLPLRLSVYVTVAFTVYLSEFYPSGLSVIGAAEYPLLVVLVLGIVATIRAQQDASFRLSPMDFLVLLMAVAVAMLPEGQRDELHLVPITVKLIVLFYASELALRYMRTRWSVCTLACLSALLVMMVRGLTL